MLPDTVGERTGDDDELEHRDGDADADPVTLCVTVVELLVVTLVDGDADTLRDEDCDAEGHAVALNELSAERDADRDAVVVIVALEQCVGDDVVEADTLTDKEGEIVVDVVDEVHAVALAVLEVVELGDAEAETLAVEELRGEEDIIDEDEKVGECVDDCDVETDGQLVVDKDAVILGENVGDMEDAAEFVAEIDTVKDDVSDAHAEDVEDDDAQKLAVGEND